MRTCRGEKRVDITANQSGRQRRVTERSSAASFSLGIERVRVDDFGDADHSDGWFDRHDVTGF
jgi:hypothetical protein